MRFGGKIMTAVLAGLSLVGLSGASARSAVGQETTIYSFNLPIGSFPETGLLMDAKGNLFGTTSSGGTYNSGTVFELTPVAGGGWTETVLHDFQVSEGQPGSALIFDSKGNLYGVTGIGGSVEGAVGSVFEVSPVAGGSWIETVIYNFGLYATDGLYPNDSLAIDANGNLYGTTKYGGSNGLNPYDVGGGYGTVFELVPARGGSWIEKVLYNFGATSTDGIYPAGGVVIDSAGHLYGTTSAGGAYAFTEGGTVFELTLQESGSWTEAVLHSFDPYVDAVCAEGFNPEYNLVQDGKGNLYGATVQGGCFDGFSGTVFELSPDAGGSWTEEEFSFPGGIAGDAPSGPLTLDVQGNLYGTMLGGGAGDAGVVFKLTPLPNGSWSETVLHSFGYLVGDGFSPRGRLLLDAKGNVLGTAQGGGTFGPGTVFEIPAEAAPVLTTIEFTANPDANLVPGERIILTAKVTAATGPAIPTGTVTFTDPAFQAGGSAILPLKNGVAVYYGKVPPAGTYSIFATYSGASGFEPSYSSAMTRTVTVAPPQ